MANSSFKLTLLTQRIGEDGGRPVYVNPRAVLSLYQVKDDGTGILMSGNGGYNGQALHVNENIHVVAALLEGKAIPKTPKRKQRPRRGR